MRYEDGFEYTKAHSPTHASELVARGWKIVSEFRDNPSDEPYEYRLRWEGEGEPVSTPTSHRGAVREG